MSGTERKGKTMDLGITGVAAVTVICYLAAQAVKATPVNNKWIPVICGICGGLLGIAAMALMPGYPAEDPITAAAVGVAWGLAATGVNQAYKQLSGKNES